jgi:hypothetical protein
MSETDAYFRHWPEVWRRVVAEINKDGEKIRYTVWK